MKILTGHRADWGLAVFNGSAASIALIPVNRRMYQTTLIFGRFSGSPQIARPLSLSAQAGQRSTSGTPAR